MTEANLKIGDILYSSWGYDQTNIDFYEVVKLSKCFAELMPIESRVTSYDDHCMDTVVPVPGKRVAYHNNEPEPTLRRKVTRTDLGIFVKISSYEYARPWNGTPKKQTNSMCGH